MGQLTAQQDTAIRTRRPVVQKWWARIPTDAAHTGWADVLIDEGIFPDTVNARVIDPGKRKHVAANKSPLDRTKLKPTQYGIAVANSDGYFYRLNGSVWDWQGTYLAWPQECYLKHKVYLRLQDGTLDELAMVAYTGRILEIHYEDVAGAGAGVPPQPGQAIIRSEAVAAWGILRREFTRDDGRSDLITDATGDFEWTTS